MIRERKPSIEPRGSPEDVDFVEEANRLFVRSKNLLLGSKWINVENELKALAEVRQNLDLLFRISRNDKG